VALRAHDAGSASWNENVTSSRGGAEPEGVGEADTARRLGDTDTTADGCDDDCAAGERVREGGNEPLALGVAPREMVAVGVTVPLPLRVVVPVALCVGVPDRVCVTVAVRDALPDEDGDSVAVPVVDAVVEAEPLGLREAVRVPLGLAVLVLEGLAPKLSDAVGVGVRVGVPEPLPLALPVLDAVEDGVGVNEGVGDGVGGTSVCDSASAVANDVTFSDAGENSRGWGRKARHRCGPTGNANRRVRNTTGSPASGTPANCTPTAARALKPPGISGPVTTLATGKKAWRATRVELGSSPPVALDTLYRDHSPAAWSSTSTVSVTAASADHVADAVAEAEAANGICIAATAALGVCGRRRYTGDSKGNWDPAAAPLDSAAMPLARHEAPSSKE